MESSGLKISQNCSPRPLQEYIDGELDQHQESALLEHISTCKTCNDELNFHKTVFGESREFENDIEIPLNFAEVVTTNAESQISGLRRRKEWIAALSVVAFLAFATLVLISFDVSRPFGATNLLIGKLAALLAMIGNFLGNMAIGVLVIVRVMIQGAASAIATALFCLAIFLMICFIWLIRSGKFSRPKELKR